MIILTENEERVFDQLPEDEVGIETFPIPCDLDHFFKHDINQFVSIAAMVLDKMAGILVINDSHAESIEIENLLIQNYYRICSVQDGMHGKEILQKALQTRHPIDLIILDLINQNYPGCLFLAELSSLSILLPVIVISTLEYSKERILTKTAYSVSSILSKRNQHKSHSNDWGDSSLIRFRAKGGKMIQEENQEEGWSSDQADLLAELLGDKQSGIVQNQIQIPSDENQLLSDILGENALDEKLLVLPLVRLSALNW